MLIEDQSEVRQFLENFPDLSGQLQRQIETHISHVYIFTDRVFKLKKAVKLPYLDFSTAEKRLQMCHQELKLNRRTAPDMYRAVHTVNRKRDGSLGLGDEGSLVDALLEMVPFDQDGLFDSLVSKGRLENSTLDLLANQIADFHLSLPALTSRSGSESLSLVQRSNEKAFAETILVKDDDVIGLLAECRDQIDQCVELLDDRSSKGYLRRCHGDLHLGNICIFEGMPTLFDCLEFDERLAEIDVLYDLAFLLMDLWQHGRPDAANRVFNRYLDRTGDTGALTLMPLFMSLRATIRGHVTAAQLHAKKFEDIKQEAVARKAKSYIDLARVLLRPAPPQLVAIAGLSGSGKSTAAAAIASYVGATPGARILSTDRIRKALFGIDPLEQLPAAAYAPDVSDRVYELQRKQAQELLRRGWSVIADGVFLHSGERVAIEDIARQARVPFAGIWLRAPTKELLDRVERRRNDPSDATPAVVHMQSSLVVEPSGWAIIDADQPIDRSTAIIRRVLSVSG